MPLFRHRPTSPATGHRGIGRYYRWRLEAFRSTIQSNWNRHEANEKLQQVPRAAKPDGLAEVSNGRSNSSDAQPRTSSRSDTCARAPRIQTAHGTEQEGVIGRPTRPYQSLARDTGRASAPAGASAPLAPIKPARCQAAKSPTSRRSSAIETATTPSASNATPAPTNGSAVSGTPAPIIDPPTHAPSALPKLNAP